jgi:hypothetical protein
VCALIARATNHNHAELITPHGRAAQVLDHVYWLGPSKKLERVCLLADTRPAQWVALASVRPPPWRAAMPELLELMGGSYGGGLQELARLLRNARAHAVENLERAPAELRAAMRGTLLELVASNRDELLVEYVTEKVPEAFFWLLSLSE